MSEKVVGYQTGIVYRKSNDRHGLKLKNSKRY